MPLLLSPCTPRTEHRTGTNPLHEIYSTEKASGTIGILQWWFPPNSKGPTRSQMVLITRMPCLCWRSETSIPPCRRESVLRGRAGPEHTHGGQPRSCVGDGCSLGPPAVLSSENALTAERTFRRNQGERKGTRSTLTMWGSLTDPKYPPTAAPITHTMGCRVLTWPLLPADCLSSQTNLPYIYFHHFLSKH